MKNLVKQEESSKKELSSAEMMNIRGGEVESVYEEVDYCYDDLSCEASEKKQTLTRKIKMPLPPASSV